MLEICTDAFQGAPCLRCLVSRKWCATTWRMDMSDRKKKCTEATIAAGAGSAAGAAVTKVAGVTAVGVLTKGAAGGGAAAGPVGAAIGALVGLAGYGLYKVFSDDD